PLGGDYWRQAVFYKILVDNYAQKDWTVVSTEFNFVEPDKKKKYQSEKLVIGPADMETVRQQVVDTWHKIRNREFYIGCGKDDCHWCGFVKTNQMAVALHSISEDEEETREG
ncbi:MAG TPA: ATP-dependent helicase, partial [Ferruginibacter sp.]|nr:ATP-dependent helicase [Ferruginibacter sp.]